MSQYYIKFHNWLSTITALGAHVYLQLSLFEGTVDPSAFHKSGNTAEYRSAHSYVKHS